MSFPTTHWSRLAIATLHGEGDARIALEQLCRDYWRPVYGYICWRGLGEGEAEDLTQEFMLHVIETSLFRRADRLRVQFRSFLLGALVRFLWDARDKRNALKRGGGVRHVSTEVWEMAGGPDQPAVAGPGAAVFDREWGLTLLERALECVRARFDEAGRAADFALLKGFLPGGGQDSSYERAAREMGLSVPAFKSEVHRLRVRFREVIREEVARGVSAPHEVELEMAHLGQVLMDKGTDLEQALKPEPAKS
jgi:DNA-directed RNA polymerase specialized sigma24 family protein